MINVIIILNYTYKAQISTKCSSTLNTDYIKHGSKAEKVWRRTKLPRDLKLFKDAKNNCNVLMNEAKRKFYTEFISEHSINPRKLFEAAKRLLFKEQRLSLPDYKDNNQLTNDLGKFFIQKIAKIRTELDVSLVTNQERDFRANELQVKELTHFELLSEEDVLSLLSSLPKKSCKLDPMPTNLLIRSISSILPVITTSSAELLPRSMEGSNSTTKTEESRA